MMSTKTVYLVYHVDVDAINELMAAFDNKDDLEAFMHRFKDGEDVYQVMEMPLNPQFRGDRTRNPYKATLDKSGAVNYFTSYHPNATEKAFENRHGVFNDHLGRPAYLEHYLLAETEEEALSKGMARMEQLVAEGVFEIEGVIRKDNF